MRAQVSSEFVVVYAALMLIFVVVFTILFGGNFNLFQAQDLAAAQRDSQSIATAINFVYLAGDGASYNFTPEDLSSAENITITPFGVGAQRVYDYAGASLLDGQTNASSLGIGSVVIRDNAGEIYIGG